LPADPLFNSNRIRINTVVLELRLRTIYAFREYIEAGGLMPSTCLSALVTDRAIEAWYHPSIA